MSVTFAPWIAKFDQQLGHIQRFRSHVQTMSVCNNFVKDFDPTKHHSTLSVRLQVLLVQ